jgi:hypothetical protein
MMHDDFSRFQAENKGFATTLLIIFRNGDRAKYKSNLELHPYYFPLLLIFIFPFEKGG